VATATENRLNVSGNPSTRHLRRPAIGALADLLVRRDRLTLLPIDPAPCLGVRIGHGATPSCPRPHATCRRSRSRSSPLSSARLRCAPHVFRVRLSHTISSFPVRHPCERERLFFGSFPTIQNSALVPLAEALVHRFPMAGPLGQITPRTSSSIAIEHGFDEQAVIFCRASHMALAARKKILDPAPVVVSQSLASHR
jgi:hypothetical protein